MENAMQGAYGRLIDLLAQARADDALKLENLWPLPEADERFAWYVAEAQAVFNGLIEADTLAVKAVPTLAQIIDIQPLTQSPYAVVEDEVEGIREAGLVGEVERLLWIIEQGARECSVAAEAYE